jgi:single-strand DNA-binding protein
MNNVNLIGRITATPELRHTGTSGKPVCNFSVAVERKFKDADGNAIVDYVDCVIWNQGAEFLCKWFDKGVRVGLTGELQTRRYEKDGQTHKITEVLVSTVEFADGKRDANTNIGASTTTSAVDADDDFLPLGDDDDSPFN